MCAPSVIEAALAGMTRRDAIHFAAGVVAGVVACAACGTAHASGGTADEPARPGVPGAKRTSPGLPRQWRRIDSSC